MLLMFPHVPAYLRMLLLAERQNPVLKIPLTAVTNFPSQHTFSYAISEECATVLQTVLV